MSTCVNYEKAITVWGIKYRCDMAGIEKKRERRSFSPGGEILPGRIPRLSKQPLWERSRTGGFLRGKFKMLNSKREIPCREGSASVPWEGLRDITLFLSLTDDNQTLLGYLSPCCERNCFHLNTHRYFDKPSSRFDFQARKKTQGCENQVIKTLPVRACHKVAAKLFLQLSTG